MKNCLTRGKWATDDDGDGDEGVKVELVPTRAVICQRNFANFCFCVRI